MINFTNWMKLQESKNTQKVEMPKKQTNVIDFKQPKERIPGGRKNTTFNSRPKRLRTRGDEKRRAISED